MEVSGGSISFLVKIKEAETELYLKTQMLYSKSHIKMSCREFLYLKLIVPSKIEKSHGEYKKGNKCFEYEHFKYNEVRKQVGEYWQHTDIKI